MNEERSPSQLKNTLKKYDVWPDLWNWIRPRIFSVVAHTRK